MTDEDSASDKHHYVHQEDNVIARVDTFDNDDDDVLISVTFDGNDHPHSAEVFSMDQVKFLHDRLGRILDDA